MERFVRAFVGLVFALCLLLGAAPAIAQAPTLSAIAPSSGSPSGASVIRLTGSGFADNDTMVSVDGQETYPFTIQSSTSMSFIAPPHAEGQVAVTVRTSAGTSNPAPGGFTYAYTTGVPVVREVSPRSVNYFPGTFFNVVLQGDNLEDATDVLFGGVSAEFIYFMDGRLYAVLPEGSGEVDVQVVTPHGTSAPNADSKFGYKPPATITAVRMIEGNGVVFIDGTNLFGISSVLIGMQSVDYFDRNTEPGNPGTFLAVVTRDDVITRGWIDVSVLSTAGGASARVYVGAPRATGISTATGPAAGGTSVTVTGDGYFAGQTFVTMGGTVVPASAVTLNGTSSLTFLTPSHPAGNVAVTVSTQQGTSEVVPGGYTFVSNTPAPSLSFITPASGSTAGGTLVTLGGAEFLVGATSVTVGGTVIPAADVTVASPTSLSFTTPAHAAGNVAVSVTTEGGTSASVSGGFTYVAPTPAPTLLMILPASGPTAGGTSISLVGTDFVAGSTSVTIGGAAIPAAGVTVSSATALTFTTPAHVAGAVAVTATTPNGTSAAIAGGFTYVATPPIAGPVNATVAFGANNAPITLALTGGAAASLDTPTTPNHGTATISGIAITYTPNVGYSGADSFTYTATNPDGISSPATVSVTVSPPVVLVTGPGAGVLPPGIVGTAYHQTFFGSGGQGGLSFTVSSGSLPPGLTLSLGGALSGAPTTAGVFAFSIRASDSSPAPGPYLSTAAAYSLTIDAASGTVVTPATIPTLSEWAMILFGALLAGGAMIMIEPRRKAT